MLKKANSASPQQSQKTSFEFLELYIRFAR